MKAYKYLKTFVWCLIGVFVARSIYTCIDFNLHPEMYIYSSAPWYTSILVNAVSTSIIIVILLIIMFIIKRSIR